MKYYIGEYWYMTNSNDAETREFGEKKWNETAKKYGSYFESIKDRLPKKFYKEFDKNKWFHDFHFVNLNITNIGKCKTDVVFTINMDEISYNITFLGTKELIVNIPQTQNWLMGKLTWGYTEFELNDDKSWTIRILCDLDNEINIRFKNIKINKF